ncbi:MAG: histidine kinase [Pseudomonadota bacterium]
MRLWLISLLATLAFNTAIAGLLTLVGFGYGFWINWVYSQCIGLAICAANTAVMLRVRDWRRWPLLALVFPASVLLGVTLGAWLTGLGGWDDPRAWTVVLIGFFFGGIGGITYYLSERVQRLDAEVKQRQLQQSETERRAAEARLKLLQAQIEPHFLFNTLANVGSLIDTDPAQARRLLDRLNDWLRGALARTRSETTTLGDELDLLEHYLQILAIRFGTRLDWRIDADGAARHTPFPPMLLQPLVENAIHHGIEPKLGGGRVHIQAQVDGQRLRIQVVDDGAGLHETPSPGTGLANVTARLAALYGDGGRFSLAGNPDGGATALLEIPR